MLWVALAAAQFSAPQPVSLSFGDYERAGEETLRDATGTLRLAFTIDPSGRIARCEVEQSSGNPHLDNHTCDLALRRASFRPARSTNGVALYGVYRVPFQWSVAPPTTMKYAGDLLVTLTSAPRGIRFPVPVRVMFEVDEHGAISSCRQEEPPDEIFAASKDEPAWARKLLDESLTLFRNGSALAPLACARLLKSFKAGPVISERGEPVSSIQDAQVVFTTK